MRLAAGFLLVWLSISHALGASFTLTPAQVAEATRVGQESVASPEFGKEWEVANAKGETVTVLTPFHRVALAARNAAFKNDTVRPREIEAILKNHQGRLAFRAALRGNRADFARWYQPILLTPRNEEIKPSFVQNERTALRLEDGQHLARCLYAFPAEGLSPSGRVTVLIRDRENRNISRFTVDLSTIR